MTVWIPSNSREAGGIPALPHGKEAGFQQAGADVPYAPGLTVLAGIRQVITSVDRPVNVLVLPGGPRFPNRPRPGSRVPVGGPSRSACSRRWPRPPMNFAAAGPYTFLEWAGAGRAIAAEAFRSR